MEIISYILSGISLALLIGASLIKGTRINLILLFVFTANILIAVNYFITDGINGAATCFVGAILTIINYSFGCKNKKVPIWLGIVYSIVFIGINIFVSGGISLLVIFVIIAALAFVMSITQENGKTFRFWTIINALAWCIYDVLAKVYAPLLQHIAHFLFTVVGMVIHDFRDKKARKN